MILERIKSSKQPLLFRDFMQMALYDPQLVYYSIAKEKISSPGDFITAS
ncbi:SAM-dependent methyltransferase, partial [Francisella tularensis subsp. holarctica]|nr:SAM-dependent methyltransferase [Francisella tularensis subsp. holarctica]